MDETNLLSPKGAILQTEEERIWPSKFRKHLKNVVPSPPFEVGLNRAQEFRVLLPG